MKFKPPSKASLYFQGLFWIAFGGLSMIVVYLDFSDATALIPAQILNLFIHVFLANVNLYLLIPNLFRAKKYLAYFGLLLVLFLGCSGAKIGLLHLAANLDGAAPDEGNIYVISFIASAFVIVVTLPFLLFDHLIEKEKLEGQLKTQKLESEVRFLRAQLNPHFLFNVLNNVYSMVFTGSPEAGPTVMKLSEMMRYLLYQTEEKRIPLLEEVSFVRKFIELHVLKQEGSPSVQFETGELPHNFLIPPLLLIPLFENAFKYSNWDAEDGSGWIKGALRVQGAEMHFELSNTIRRIKENKAPGGVGLQNLKQRLLLLYPHRHRLEINESVGIFKIMLTLQSSHRKKLQEV